MSRLLSPKRVPKKAPPDDETNLRGRLFELRTRLRRKARARASDQASYERALAALTREAAPRFRDLESRLAAVRHPGKEEPGSSGKADLLETLRSL